jgi:hypothetical protein
MDSVAQRANRFGKSGAPSAKLQHPASAGDPQTANDCLLDVSPFFRVVTWFLECLIIGARCVKRIHSPAKLFHIGVFLSREIHRFQGAGQPGTSEEDGARSLEADASVSKKSLRMAQEDRPIGLSNGMEWLGQRPFSDCRRGIAGDDRLRGNVPRDNGTGADDRAMADLDAREDESARADEGIGFDDDL